MDSGSRDETNLSPEETSRREFMLNAGKLAVYTAPAVMLLMRPAKDAIAASTGIPNPPEGPEDSWHPGTGTPDSGPSNGGPSNNGPSNDGPSGNGPSDISNLNPGPSGNGPSGSGPSNDGPSGNESPDTGTTNPGGANSGSGDSELSGSGAGNSSSRHRKPWFWRWLSFWD